MIDTVVLKIPKIYLKIKNQQLWQSFTQSRHAQKWVRNTSSDEKKMGIYRPRLTASKRPYDADSVKIEFSCPKMIHGNNLEELSEQDFPRLIAALRQSLSEMGIDIEVSTLENADVMAFHPSKNIRLMGGYTVPYVIKQLAKIDLNKTFDLNKTDYRNGGLSLQGYTNSHSVVFYDKMADINKPAKRAIDKDQQIKLLGSKLENLKNKSVFEVLRMEIRLIKRTKIRSVMRTLQCPSKIKFKDLFSNNLCQKVLNWYWKALIKNHNGFLFETNSAPQLILRDFLHRPSPPKLKEAIYFTGLKTLGKDEAGIRNLRQIIEGNFSDRSWYRIKSDIRKINQMSSSQQHGWIENIEDALSKFKPFKAGLDCKEK